MQFAFGVVLFEVAACALPWAFANPWAIVREVVGGRRPALPPAGSLPGLGAAPPPGFPAYVQLMERCWAQAPAARPSFAEIVAALEALGAEAAAAERGGGEAVEAAERRGGEAAATPVA